ncbi:hypothetical protein CA13_54040 [Planctomycetes bacterium CA13]|uniref:General secretion pathway GspH domain-containing protein n=1 Tax=Novipirellula herctigrandis TaxID=2527986 RepID=A0A5C5Z9Q7_9BACT|nr:hypothetical protein CA13_54040 [Planctomycetes bacterium CA13]
MRHRIAFTLLELLLTLAIFAAMTAVIIPKLAPLLGEQNLVRAAEQLRIEMTRMRIEAMRGGQVMIVQGEIGTSTLQVKPYISASDAIETVGGSNSQSGLLTGADQAAVVAMPFESEVEEKTIDLPEEVTIESIVVVSSARSFQMGQETGSGQMTLDPTIASTSPILFYADGTTSTAAVTLTHPTSGRVTVKLRGITGESTIGEVSLSEVIP